MQISRLYIYFILITIYGCSDAQDAVRPNIVVVLADDQGWGDLSAHGNTNLSTPNIDAIAESGAQFEYFYVQPVCSPTRAELLTGRYAARMGVSGTSEGRERMDLSETTIADILKEHDYSTGAFGKWHNGMQFPYHPNGRGFDTYYGFCSGHWGNYFDAQMESNGALVKGEGFIIDDITNKAISFIENNAAAPFFAYIAYNTPHSPMQVPDNWWAKYDTTSLKMRHNDPNREDINHTKAALALCENIDWNVGRIKESLQSMGIYENTIIMYLTDNGPNGNRWNNGFRGKKGSTDEGGVRSPLFVQWPAMIKSGIRVNNMASVTDILPSLTEILGVQSKIPFDGKSFWPYINNPDSINNDRVIVNHWKDKTSVRTQRFRLDHENRLYDITKDKEQLKDVSENYPEELIKLKEYKQKFLSDAVAPSIESAPIPMGYAYDWVQLPARDANFTGRIKRSNRWPNCSFLTDWKSSTDSIYWEVELVENAEYAVVLYYTADRNNVGTELILDYNGQSIKSPIKESFLSNFKNVEYDRAPRENSFMKDFKALDMGNIQLEKGKGNLVLTAPNVHPTGIDFRLLMLERIN